MPLYFFFVQFCRAPNVWCFAAAIPLHTYTHTQTYTIKEKFDSIILLQPSRCPQEIEKKNEKEQ
jgi:hypothetical protein